MSLKLEELIKKKNKMILDYLKHKADFRRASELMDLKK